MYYWATSYGTIVVLGRLPHTVLGPSVLSKRVETGPTGTQLGLACAQTIPRLPRACLRRAEQF